MEKRLPPGDERPACGNCWFKTLTAELALVCGGNPPGAMPIAGPGGQMGTVTFRPTVQAKDKPCHLWVHEDDDPFAPFDEGGATDSNSVICH